MFAIKNRLPLCGLALALSAAQVTAGELYRWMDDQGQVHYSDERPAQSHDSIEIQPSPPAADGDRYSVVEQAERMEADRRRREETRQAEARQRLELQREALELEAARAAASRAATATEPRPYYANPWPWVPRSYPERPDRHRPPFHPGPDWRPPEDSRHKGQGSRLMTIPRDPSAAQAR